MNQPADLTELSRCLATEIAALTNRLVSARAQEVIRGLDAARRAVEAAAMPIDEQLNVPGIADEELQRIRERLSSNAAIAAVRKQLHDRTAAVGHMRDALDRANADLAAARADLDAERERPQAAVPDVARMAAEFEATIEEMRREHAAAIGEQAIACTSLPLDALLTVFNTVKRATTASGILGSVVDGLAREFSRVALFNVQENRLEGARQTGFTFDSDISKLRVPLTPESLLSRAIGSGRLEACFPSIHGEAGLALPFGGTPSCAMAIPFRVNGAAVAMIYADDSDMPEFATAAPQTRAKFAELVQQHAALALLGLGAGETKTADLRRFAGLLVDEIEYAHAADVKAGRNALERQQTLRHQVEHARRLHAERTNQDAAAAAVFEEHLAALIEARRDSVFGTDLGHVLGVAAKGQRASILTMRR
ncbi:MAG TPA: hypothetical protein VKC35_07865 [Vicinamibacterales bacterium]|nr:hypothetical protein [Vicinamibacterales bacterium]